VGAAAPEHEAPAVPAQVAARAGAELVAVVWAALEAEVVAPEVGAVEVAAEQGNKSRLFFAGPLRSTFF
jgi:hypothetical protein